MAIAQTEAQGGKIGQIHPKSADGFDYVMIGTIWFVVGGGAPTAGASSELKDAPQGSLYLDITNSKLMIKSSIGDGTTNTSWRDLSLTS